MDASKDEVRDVLKRNWLLALVETDVEPTTVGVLKPDEEDEPMMALILSCFCCFSRALRAVSSRSIRSCNSAIKFLDSLSYFKSKHKK